MLKLSVDNDVVVENNSDRAKKQLLLISDQIFAGERELNFEPSLDRGSKYRYRWGELLKLSEQIIHFLNIEPMFNPKEKLKPGQERSETPLPTKSTQLTEILIDLCMGDAEEAAEFLGNNSTQIETTRKNL